MRLSHPSRGEALQLLADDPDLASLLDLVAHQPKAGAVDATRGNEVVDPLEGAGQWKRDFRAYLRDELVPALVFPPHPRQKEQWRLI
jgi:hypothetical protein